MATTYLSTDPYAGVTAQALQAALSGAATGVGPGRAGVPSAGTGTGSVTGWLGGTGTGPVTGWLGGGGAAPVTNWQYGPGTLPSAGPQTPKQPASRVGPYTMPGQNADGSLQPGYHWQYGDFGRWPVPDNSLNGGSGTLAALAGSPAVGTQRTINGQPATWDGTGWTAIGG
jgi:hypothetical protein